MMQYWLWFSFLVEKLVLVKDFIFLLRSVYLQLFCFLRFAPFLCMGKLVKQLKLTG